MATAKGLRDVFYRMGEPKRPPLSSPPLAPRARLLSSAFRHTRLTALPPGRPPPQASMTRRLSPCPGRTPSAGATRTTPDTSGPGRGPRRSSGARRGRPALWQSRSALLVTIPACRDVVASFSHRVRCVSLRPQITATSTTSCSSRPGRTARTTGAPRRAAELPRRQPDPFPRTGWLLNPPLFSSGGGGSFAPNPYCRVPDPRTKQFQYQDPSGTLMMLPSDIVLIQVREGRRRSDANAPPAPRRRARLTPALPQRAASGRKVRAVGAEVRQGQGALLRGLQQGVPEAGGARDQGAEAAPDGVRRGGSKQAEDAAGTTRTSSQAGAATAVCQCT